LSADKAEIFDGGVRRFFFFDGNFPLLFRQVFPADAEYQRISLDS